MDMGRRLAAVWACVVLALIGAGSAHSAPRTVYIVDRSETVHVSDIENALPAFQAGVSEDFAPIWGQDAQLVVTGTPPAGGWTLTVDDWSDQFGALGYHGLEGNTPYGKVFVQDTIVNKGSWQSVLDHELKEMLADPYIDRLVLGSRLWLVEVADPVESEAYNYARRAVDGSLVPLSDFVTPAWYRKSGRGPYDFRRYVKRRGQVLPGGYVSYWTSAGWRQITNF